MSNRTPFRIGTYRADGETTPGLIGMVGDRFITVFAREGDGLYELLKSTGLTPEWLFGQALRDD